MGISRKIYKSVNITINMQEIIENTLISELDFVYIGEMHSNPRIITKIHYGNREISGFEDVWIFAAFLAPHPRTQYFPIPLISLGKPKRTSFPEYMRYDGGLPGKLADGILEVNPGMFESSIDQYPDGKAYVYSGLMNWIKGYVFEEPLRFDPNKELFFMRSPNKTLKMESILSESFREKENTELLSYSLVYDNLHQLKTNHRWAVGVPFFKYKNMHLF